MPLKFCLNSLPYLNSKNYNTYEGLSGISPSGAVLLLSYLYPGSVSDKELTRRSGILDLLDEGNRIMEDQGFDIKEDLALLGVRLNIPPFMKGKKQLDKMELVETSRMDKL